PTASRTSRPLRSFPTRRSSDLLHPLHGLDQRITVGLAAGLLQRLVDQVDAVITADRHEARTLGEGLPVRGDEVLVHRGWMGGGIDRKSTRLNSSHQIISYAVFC